jgi:hypothetical protein
MTEFIKYIKGPIFILLVGLSLSVLMVLLTAIYFNDKPLIGMCNAWSFILIACWATYLYTQHRSFRHYKSFHRKK